MQLIGQNIYFFKNSVSCCCYCCCCLICVDWIQKYSGSEHCISKVQGIPYLSQKRHENKPQAETLKGFYDDRQIHVIIALKSWKCRGDCDFSCLKTKKRLAGFPEVLLLPGYHAGNNVPVGCFYLTYSVHIYKVNIKLFYFIKKLT